MPDTFSLALRSAAITDIGRVRRQNEDRFLRDDHAAFYAVADGIGGLPGGAAAAQTCIEALAERLSDLALLPSAAGLIPPLRAVNHRVFQLGLRLSPRLGLGCTLVCAAVRDDRLLLAHVGDSRCYLIRDGHARLLTQDHSLANDLARFGDRAPVDYNAAQLSALTRCIGQPEAPLVDTLEVSLQRGDRILLATDGVSRVITDAELPGFLDGDAPLASRLGDMIKAIHHRGAPDNSTAVVVVVD